MGLPSISTNVNCICASTEKTKPTWLEVVFATISPTFTLSVTKVAFASTKVCIWTVVEVPLVTCLLYTNTLLSK